MQSESSIQCEMWSLREAALKLRASVANGLSAH